MNDIVRDLYNDQFEKYYDEYEELFDAKHKSRNFRLKDYRKKKFFDKRIQKLIKNKNQKIKY